MTSTPPNPASAARIDASKRKLVLRRREIVGIVVLAIVFLALAVLPWLNGIDSRISYDNRRADLQPDYSRADSSYVQIDWATHIYQTGSILSYAAIALLALMTLVVPLLISSTVGTLESRISELQYLTGYRDGDQEADRRNGLFVLVIRDLVEVHSVYDNFKKRYRDTYGLAISCLVLTAALLVCPYKAWWLYAASTILFFASIALVILTSIQIFTLFSKQPPMRHLFRYGALLALSQTIKVGDGNQAEEIRAWWIPRIGDIKRTGGIKPQSAQPPWQPPSTALTEVDAQNLVKLYFDP